MTTKIHLAIIYIVLLGTLNAQACLWYQMENSDIRLTGTIDAMLKLTEVVQTINERTTP